MDKGLWPFPPKTAKTVFEYSVISSANDSPGSDEVPGDADGKSLLRKELWLLITCPDEGLSPAKIVFDNAAVNLRLSHLNAHPSLGDGYLFSNSANCTQSR